MSYLFARRLKGGHGGRQGLLGPLGRDELEGVEVASDSVRSEVPGYGSWERILPPIYSPQSWPDQPEDPVSGAGQASGNKSGVALSRTSGGPGSETAS